MKERTQKVAFVLLILGTLGLITEEFALPIGRIATLVFAALNVIGLIALGIARRMKDSDDS